MKLLYLLSVFLIVSCSSHKHRSISAKSANRYFLQGNIEGRDSGIVLIGTYDTTRQGPLLIFDSAKISDSYFHFQGKLAMPLICKLKIRNLEYGWPYTDYFVLDTGITRVKLFKDSMANSVVIGSILNDKLLAFNKNLTEMAIDFDKNFSLNEQGVITDDSLEILESAFYRNRFNLILRQIEENPTSITSAFISQTILNGVFDVTMLEEICKALSRANDYFARYLFSKLAAIKQTAVGLQAPYFEVTDDKNMALNNDSIKGKYFLLDFWASWCKPCREESPNLVETYKKYADKGLEMMSVSIDYDRNEWEIAMKEDGLDWIQVCVGPNSKIYQDFGINFIPSNILIDPQGKIIAKNLIGADLQRFIAEHLQNN